MSGILNNYANKKATVISDGFFVELQGVVAFY
jgi:hypothetical protein